MILIFIIYFRHYDKYNKEYAIAIEDVSSYLSNPLNTFKIIKRLNLDWVHTYSVMDHHVPGKTLYLEYLYESVMSLACFLLIIYSCLLKLHPWERHHESIATWQNRHVGSE